jgi:hypothetical protein
LSGIKPSGDCRFASSEQTVDAIHCKKTAGYFAPVFQLAFENKRPVSNRREAYVFVEKRAERAKTLEANLEADIGDGQSARGEQLLGSLYASIPEVLMWGLVERSPEEPEKVKPREASFARDLIEIERQVIAFVYEPPSTRQPSVRVGGDRLFKRELVLVSHRRISFARVA